MKYSLLILFILATSSGLFTANAHAEYVKKPISSVNRIEAKCNMAALNSMSGFDVIGDYMVATAVKNNFMAAEGYAWKKPPRAAKAKKPVGTSGRNSLANEQ